MSEAKMIEGEDRTSVCVDCSEDFTFVYLGGPNKKRCDECRNERARSLQRGRNARLKSSGACPKCGTDRPEDFTHIAVTGRRKTYCDRDNAENSRNQNRWRLDNLDLARERSYESNKLYVENNPELAALSRVIYFSKNTPEENREYWRFRYHMYRAKNQLSHDEAKKRAKYCSTNRR